MSSLRWMTYCGLKEELDDARAELLAAQTPEHLDRAIRAELALNEFVQDCIYDAERIDVLEEAGAGHPWVGRLSARGRGVRLHNSTRDDAVPTVRQAIDNFRDWLIMESLR